MLNLDYYEDRNNWTDEDYEDYASGGGVFSWERKKAKPRYKVYYQFCEHNEDNVNREDW